MKDRDQDVELDWALERHFEADGRSRLEAAPPRFSPGFVDEVLARRARARQDGAARRLRRGMRIARAARVGVGLALAAGLAGLLFGAGLLGPRAGDGGGRETAAVARWAPGSATAEPKDLVLPEMPTLDLPGLAPIQPASIGAEGVLVFSYLDGLYPGMTETGDESDESEN